MNVIDITNRLKKNSILPQEEPRLREKNHTGAKLVHFPDQASRPSVKLKTLCRLKFEPPDLTPAECLEIARQLHERRTDDLPYA